MPSHRFNARSVGVALAALLIATAPSAGIGQTTRKPAASEADLPRYSYTLDGSASALLQSDPATFTRFTDKLLADIDATLALYDVRDHATLRALLNEKLEIDVLTGKNTEALALISQISALEDTPDAALTSMLRTRAILRARHDTGMTEGPDFERAFAKDYAAAILPLPYGTVSTAIKEQKDAAELLSPTVALGAIQAHIDPAVEKTHAVSGRVAATIVDMRFFDSVTYATKTAALATLSAYLAAHTSVQKPDIWKAREVDLTEREHTTPVVVAIWDGGSDTTLFPHQLFVDEHAPAADAHGIAFDEHGFPAHGDLFPLTPDQERQYPSMIRDLQGFSDLQSSIESPQAAEVKKKLAGLTPAQFAAYLESDDLYAGAYGHGTHVAGIALAGNPAARLLVGRLSYHYKAIPPPPTEADTLRQDAEYQKMVDYFRAHHARVVNMSWYETERLLEHDLEVNGIGGDAAARAQLAQRWYAMDRDALTRAIRSAPDILFFACAGNADDDATFNNTIPASISLPNLVTVGAVDQAGDATSFTSYGPTVRVYADGYQVVSTMPHGYHVAMSGTSMASPNVANLAAKLIALHPNLTPEQTIGLIMSGATLSADGKRKLIDPKATIARAEAH